MAHISFIVRRRTAMSLDAVHGGNFWCLVVLRDHSPIECGNPLLLSCHAATPMLPGPEVERLLLGGNSSAPSKRTTVNRFNLPSILFIFLPFQKLNRPLN